ncbi:FkbM family methyltransferase [Synechococcus sp. SynAce01]|uniref:FkbM family methyltransferase n=1 Tax=unclassified Synechococcus TaxID=2626047 RepID=UPI0009F9D5D8
MGRSLRLPLLALIFFVTMKNWNDSWEHWVHDTCRWVMPDKGIFYDIGANVGYMCIELVHSMPLATSFAFEAQAELAKALKISIETNNLSPRIRLFEAALGDVQGSAELAHFAHDGHASLISNEKLQYTKTKRATSVTVYTIDDLAANNLILPPDLIKIDVEGSEASVLNGGLDDLRNAKPNIAFECSTLGHFGNVREVLSTSGSYTFFHALGSCRPLTKVDIKTFIQKGSKIDILAVEKTRLDQLPAAFKEALCKG